jgi:hypothetical protein
MMCIGEVEKVFEDGEVEKAVVGCGRNWIVFSKKA